MPCYHLMTAWKSKEINPSGKRSLVFTPTKALQPDDPMEVTCGQCRGCRLDRSKTWAIRCMHEAQLHNENSFITLTFSDEALHKRENPYGLNHKEWQKFMKRLRDYRWNKYVPDHIKHINDRFKKLLKSEISDSQKKRLKQKQKKFLAPYQQKFYMCGEYGDKTARPHYHAIIFGVEFEDKKLYKIENGQRLYNSETLSRLWPDGFAVIGNVTFESAAYVARYIMKKQTGKAAEDYYTCMHPETGEILKKQPEYNRMSNRNAIGRDWYDSFKGDLYPKDYVTFQGKKFKVPKYYDKLYEKENPFEYDEIKQNRMLNAEKYQDNNTYDRLLVREKVLIQKLDKLPRKL